MNQEILSIIRRLENVLAGEPWYGRSVKEILEEVDPAVVFTKPGGKGHSLADLLYHMLTWAQFTLAAVQEKPAEEVRAFEKLDWRTIDPAKHTWEKGLAALKETHGQLISLLKTKEDTFLAGIVPARQYNYRVLLKGLADHNIYHIGQIAYVKKLLQ